MSGVCYTNGINRRPHQRGKMKAIYQFCETSVQTAKYSFSFNLLLDLSNDQMKLQNVSTGLLSAKIFIIELDIDSFANTVLYYH